MHKVPAKRIGDALAPRGIVDHEGIAVASGVISGGRGAPEAAASALIHRKISSWDALALDQSALMLAAIGGRTDVVRILTAAGAELCLRGTGTRPSRRNQPSPSLEVTPRWSRSCAPVLHIDPNDKKPAFRNRIFMEGGASEADISAARAGVHCRTTPSLDTDPRARS